MESQVPLDMSTSPNMETKSQLLDLEINQSTIYVKVNTVKLDLNYLMSKNPQVFCCELGLYFAQPNSQHKFRASFPKNVAM
jgi:hypothetical protein